ncbi:preprotein translocase subunit SecG [Notoacmeibacter sp. MSK16QG-6]|uniref:preprotein translocase subunit SecG n=1 Tax=Notoacmeibacter sp. MSK16QG-6 TaxID=2957982 RepID=UPI00209C8FEE|nr:preprotein translocase subunit SecG [Notoacmeibacter sp. MSK16QG-6]MCP1199329.1 preprotein translocase subunit SecG [Notoacmeibacter sp. MSK16QG-6]
MATVLIVIHLIIVIALCGIVLIQRSEGGGLGIGGGSGFMSARGTANTLTRTTAILAALFFATSLGLSLFARYGERPTDILDQIPQSGPTEDGGNLLDQLGGGLSGETEESPAPATEGEVPSGDEGAVTGQPAEGGETAPAEPVTPQPDEPSVPSGG